MPLTFLYMIIVWKLLVSTIFPVKYDTEYFFILAADIVSQIMHPSFSISTHEMAKKKELSQLLPIPPSLIISIHELSFDSKVLGAGELDHTSLKRNRNDFHVHVHG